MPCYLHLHSDPNTFIFILKQGDLEQLTVVDETFGGVSEQCSPNKVPFELENHEHSLAEIADQNADKKSGDNNDFHIDESIDKSDDDIEGKEDEQKRKGTLDSASFDKLIYSGMMLNKAHYFFLFVS